MIIGNQDWRQNMKVPFSLLPAPAVMFISRRMLGVGSVVSKMFPGLKLQLLQAGTKETPKEYGAVAFVVALSNMIILGLIFAIVGIVAKVDVMLLALGACLVVGGFSFFTIIMMPGVTASRRVKSLDNNLIPSMRQLLIEVRSGVTLFQAMTSITTGYGEVSVEFKRIVDHINVGVSETDAINEASKRNLSFKFRRVLWQISNSLTVGSDISVSLSDMIEELTKEKLDDIRRYGQELNPWTMMYMMLAVILPSLGITIAAIILSFLNIALPKMIVMPGIILGLMGFQIVFIQFVKSRRPVVD
ncbi:MAG: type II secretion system F family protein [Candidatus Micrarchaeota archaeon]|nr:type II secretion system F family protein [Candidatus Micrarchaeota archaeon]